MPLIVRWYLKTSLVYLVAALLVGIASSFQGLAPIPAGLGPVFIHLLVVGWITQLIFGVALWMFPKQSISSSLPFGVGAGTRGSERLAWAGYGLLNVGLVLRAVGEPLAAAQPGSWAGWLLVASAIIQWLAGVAFALNTWGRVKLK